MPINDDLRKELAELLLKFSIPSESNTPDMILADYLCDCLQVWNKTIRWRDGWHREYGRESNHRG